MRETKRDHELLEWLGELRIADVDAVRWALAGFAGRDEPVSGRRAQAWIARCRDAGLIETGRPTFQDGSVLWVAHHITGRAAPNLHRQTTRHEVAVSATSARFLDFHRGAGVDVRLSTLGAGVAGTDVAEGVVLTDGTTLLVAESFGQRLSAYTMQPDGSLAQPRVWCDLRPNVPDGICMDASGAVWVADPINNGVIRVGPDGNTDDWVSTGDRNAYACALGGPDLCTLFICTAESSDPVRTVASRTGRIEAVRVEVPGLPEPRAATVDLR